jgi:GT2 family glycosyltransferase
LMDHDDLLMPNALYETVKIINEHPSAELIYSDEDKIEDDKFHVEPFFKPDWNPDFMLSCNMVTHFATIRHSLMKKVGGFTIGTEGAQDWDLFLRLSELTDEIHHVPKIIYNWRKSPTSTAASHKSKNYAYVNQKKVLRNAVVRRGLSATVEQTKYMGFWRVHYQIIGTPKVSIVIPSKDNYKYIKRCLDSVFEDTSYPNFEVILVDTGTTDTKTLGLFDAYSKGVDEFRRIQWKSDGAFNFSAACNAGAKAARGEYLLFLNDDTSVIDSHWLTDLLEQAQRDEVGAVGLKLLFPNKTIQHAGVVLSDRDVAFHPFYGLDENTDIFSNIYINNIRDVSAVTGACLMVSKNKFEQVGGFDEKLRVTYNDVDLCLKLLDAGYLNVYTPFGRLYHYESVSVGKITTADRDHTELERASAEMHRRWGEQLKDDKYYNPNFTQHGPGYWLY